MTKDDVIAYVEGQFKCELGAPWRWADLGMSKPYQTVFIDGSDEHIIASAMIARIAQLKQEAGFKYLFKPKLWWRWEDKVRMTDEGLWTRLYIDGNPPYEKTNPSRPKGTAGAGQVRLLSGAA